MYSFRRVFFTGKNFTQSFSYRINVIYIKRAFVQICFIFLFHVRMLTVTMLVEIRMKLRGGFKVVLLLQRFVKRYKSGCRLLLFYQLFWLLHFLVLPLQSLLCHLFQEVHFYHSVVFLGLFWILGCFYVRQLFCVKILFIVVLLC